MYLLKHFYPKDGIIVTPSLESGCLDGCMRKYLIENQKIINLKIKEKVFIFPI